jgi:hypothetical protein
MTVWQEKIIDNSMIFYRRDFEFTQRNAEKRINKDERD